MFTLLSVCALFFLKQLLYSFVQSIVKFGHIFHFIFFRPEVFFREKVVGTHYLYIFFFAQLEVAT